MEKTGTTARSFRYDPQSGPLSMTVTGAGTHFLTSDWLGSVSDMTAVGGTREYAYTYEPFGAGPDPAPLTPAAPANPLRFTGEYRDPQTALYNLRARQYAPGLGRFTSLDPVAAPLTDPAVGPYVYAADRATVWTDPTGELPCMFGRNPDGGCRGADTAGAVARGVGAAARDFGLGLARMGNPQTRQQAVTDGLKATLADCYTGLTTAANPAAGCLANISGLTQLMQGLALAFDGCVYVGAYQATSGAIQLFLTLAPIGRSLTPAGRSATARDAASAHVATASNDEFWKLSNVGKSRPGTLVPESFDITVAGQKFSVHSNATKHMAEYARSTGTAPPISSLAGSIETAVARGLTPGRNFVTVGNWELGIDTRGNVIYHALYRP